MDLYRISCPTCTSVWYETFPQLPPHDCQPDTPVSTELDYIQTDEVANAIDVDVEDLPDYLR